MNGEPQRVRRVVILMEMENGMQMGWQADRPDLIKIVRDYPHRDYGGFGYCVPPIPSHLYGTIEAHGELTGLMRMPTDVFDDEQPAIEPHRPALNEAPS